MTDAVASDGAVIGRRTELNRLGRLVTAVAAGRGGVGWVQGEPGIGKSTLLNAAVAQAAGLGCAVRRGAASELMQPFPLGVMADGLAISGRPADPAAREIAGILRGERPVPGTVDPLLAAAERMLDLVKCWCSEGPVVVAVDDLQWADEPSLLFWNRLVRAADQIPLLLLGAARSHPPRVTLTRLRELVTDRGGTVLELGPMSAGSLTVLAGRIAGGTPGPRLRAALPQAGGNPLYVAELTAAALRDGLLDVGPDQAELRADAPASPPSLPAAISGRLQFLPEETRRTLRRAALLGDDFDVSELAVTTGRPVAELADGLADAVVSGVLAGNEERLRFRHRLIHRVLVEETPAAIRRALHGEFARLLAEAGREADGVARHLVQAPERIEDWTVSWLAAVPLAALYPRPRVAAQLLARALEAVPDTDRRWVALVTRMTQVLSWLGRHQQVRQQAAMIAGRATDPALAAQLRIEVIRAAGRMRRWPEALPWCARAGDDDDLPPGLRARLGSWSALALLSAGRTAEGVDAADDALRRALAAREPLTIGHARYAVARCAPVAERPELLREALAALAGVPASDPEAAELRMALLAELATCSVHLARREEAEAALAQGLGLAARASTYQAAMTWAVAADSAYRYGRWDEALAHLDRIDDELADDELIGSYRVLAALIALHRGDRAAADRQLGAMVSRPAPGPRPPSGLLTRALALGEEADGEIGRAADLMSGWLSAPPGLEPWERRDGELPYLTRLALEAGRGRTAQAAADLAGADAAAGATTSRVTAAAFCQALTGDDAAGLLAVAVTYQKCGWLLFQASALEEAAVRLAAAGDAVAARGALTEAARTYSSLGASWDIRRADRRLRPYGVRRGPRSTHRRASSGWPSLTPSELRIAQLVAQGLSNPQIADKLFVSRRTVQAHVSSVLAKLRLRSRVEIARAAAQHDVRLRSEDHGRPA